MNIAIFGGSFDPPHFGHLKAILKVYDSFQFDKIFFVPCKTPLLKLPTQAKPEDRLAMLHLLLKPYSFLIIDKREINRETPSYSIETLRSFRQEFPKASLTLILGLDTFLQLPKWHEWEEVLNVAHLLVLNRPHTTMNMCNKLQGLVEHHRTQKMEELVTSRKGKIFFFNAGEYLTSSTSIREKIK
jgi:nicotinate-nucleotide adenylyltransferase